MSRLDRDTDLSPLTHCMAGSVYVTEKRLVLQSFRMKVLNEMQSMAYLHYIIY